MCFTGGDKGVGFAEAEKRTFVMRRTVSIAALVALVGGLAFLAAPSAMAQTPGYPPTCNPVDGVQDAGSHQIGETFKVNLLPTCLFNPGSNIAVTVNGQSVGTKVAAADGSITVTVRVVSATELSIEDPVSVVGQCGQNKIVGTGPSATAGRNVTQTAFFTVVCPGVNPPGGGVVTPVKGTVAFTGANIAKWAGLALALIAIGAVLVILNRRRDTAKV